MTKKWEEMNLKVFLVSAKKMPLHTLWIFSVLFRILLTLKIIKVSEKKSLFIILWTLYFICLQSACNISYENSSLNVSITTLFLHGGLKMNNCFI